MLKYAVGIVALLCACSTLASAVSWSSSTGSSNTYLVNDKGDVVTSLPGGYSLILVALSGADLTSYLAGTYSAAYDASKVLSTADIKSTPAAKAGQAVGKLSWTYGTSDPIANNDVLAVLITDGTDMSNLQYHNSANGVGGHVVDTFTVSGLDNNTWNKSFYFATAGNFTVAVPEPTSGMLLLLGMAGLALKRKRA